MANQKDTGTVDPSPESPPGSWPAATRLARRALGPIERFLAIQAASGMVLLSAAAIALAWANSPWRESYAALWHLPAGLRLGPLSLESDLHFLINDVLMTVFFFVVGLEIRREIHRGELSEVRRATLSFAAALGGMVLPALIYLALNFGRESARGWGIPMATDIAFAVGVLALLGKRVPPALRILLLALAVIDDVGAILVIAVFYSSSLSWVGFLVAGGGMALIVTLQAFGVRSVWAYLAPAGIVWGGAYLAGIHPTLAGVVVGLMTPVRAWFGPAHFLQRADASLAAVREKEGKDEQEMLPHMAQLDQARREAISPVERLQHALHRWVAFAIMPLFAFANAGVSVGNVSLQGDSLFVLLGICCGLVLGKPLGILGLSWLGARLGLSSLPRGVRWSQMGLVGAVGGIGFTMALFVAQLAFPEGVFLETAKLGILLGSAWAAGLGFILGRVVLPTKKETGGTSDSSEAESSSAV